MLFFSVAEYEGFICDMQVNHLHSQDPPLPGRDNMAEVLFHLYQLT